MKLLFVHDHYFSERNGAVYSHAFPYALWERYLRHFDHLTVFARCSGTSADPAGAQLSSGANVRFRWGGNISSAGSFFGPRQKVKMQLTRLLAEHDAVIARLPSELGLVAVEVATEAGKPSLVEAVACPRDSLWHHGSIAAMAYAPIAAARMRRGVQRADFVAYVSQKFLEPKYPARYGAMVAALSDVEIADPDTDALRRRSDRIRAHGTPLVFGLIGSLKTRYKGVHTAIEALGRFNRHRSAFELRVLGSGDAAPYRRLARECGVADRVRFDGTLPSGQPVSAWLDEIDVYLQPSLTEATPRALIEAMSRGCPCIASSAGGIPDLLASECIFPPGDVNAMAAVLREKAIDATWREEQAVRNLEESRKYARHILGEKRDELLDALVHSARSSAVASKAPRQQVS